MQGGRGHGALHHLALKDMPKVAAAVFAGDLNTLHAHCHVHMTIHCIWEVVVECWPAAS